MSAIGDCVTMIRRLRKDPRVPPSVRAVAAVTGLYLLSPIDLIPDFIPVIGALDDLFIVGLALRFAARRVPREAFEEAWPGDPKTLRRLLRWTG